MSEHRYIRSLIDDERRQKALLPEHAGEVLVCEYHRTCKRCNLDKTSTWQIDPPRVGESWEKFASESKAQQLQEVVLPNLSKHTHPSEDDMVLDYRQYWEAH